MSCEEQKGFTLVETLVALIVFTAVIVALQQATAIGLRGVRIAQRQAGALELARLKLSEAGTERPITEDIDERGEAISLKSRYTWHLTAFSYTPPGTTTPVPPQMAAYWISVTVAWQDQTTERSVELKTLKLQTVLPAVLPPTAVAKPLAPAVP